MYIYIYIFIYIYIAVEYDKIESKILSLEKGY